MLDVRYFLILALLCLLGITVVGMLLVEMVKSENGKIALVAIFGFIALTAASGMLG